MNEADSPQGGPLWIGFDKLILDDENPRLPERLHRHSQSEILTYLQQQGALEELAYSYKDNGFFPQEPLLIVQKGEEDIYTVVEGNRRLAALKILHGSPEAGDLGFVGIDVPPERLAQLRDIPCVRLSDRNQVHAYLGFRHIGGLKTWPPEAKARYLLHEVRRLVGEGFTDPFRELGRRVGSNAQGVRNPYIAIRILLYGRDELSLNVAYVQDHRFGVWLRCMNSPEIKDYFGFGQVRAYGEIEDALEGVDGEKLAEVLDDLQGTGGRTRAVLGDSRDVTIYGRALAHDRARATLRATGDLSLAKQVVEDLELLPRAQRVVKSVELFLETLHRAETEDFSKSVLHAVDELSRLARSARAIVQDRMNDSDHGA